MQRNSAKIKSDVFVCLYHHSITFINSLNFIFLHSVGTILLAVPLHRADVVSDDDDTRNVKLLVRSPVPISSMMCLSSPDSGGEASSCGISGGYDNSKMASILPPRSPGVLYQMVIGFGSKVVCDEIIKFIETRRSVEWIRVEECLLIT